MTNSRSIPLDTQVTTIPKLDNPEKQGVLSVGPTGRVHKGGGLVPWYKRCVLTRAPSPAAHHILLIIGSFVSDSDTDAWPSIALIAATAGRSARVVQRCIRELREAGLVVVQLTNGGTSRYRIAPTPPASPHDARVTPPTTPASPKGVSEVISTSNIPLKEQDNKPKPNIKLVPPFPSKKPSKSYPAQVRLYAKLYRKLQTDRWSKLTDTMLDDFSELTPAAKKTVIDGLEAQERTKAAKGETTAAPSDMTGLTDLWGGKPKHTKHTEKESEKRSPPERREPGPEQKHFYKLMEKWRLSRQF